MASESNGILKAGMEGDEEKVRLGVDRLRQLLSDIQSIERKHTTHFDNGSNNLRQEITQILKEYDKCTEFVKAWTQRYKSIGPISLLLQLPDGPGGIVDMILPQAWDWNVDIIAFHSETDKRIITSIANRGQKHICVYGKTTPSAIEENVNIKFLENEELINRYFFDIRTPSRLLIYEKIIKTNPDGNDDVALKDGELINNINKAFQRAIYNRRTVNLFGLRWITQAVANLPSIACQPSFKHMAAHLENLPLVIVSPGPSLDKNIHQLHDLQNHAIIIAPAQSALAMQRENIYPDIVMVADPADLRYLLNEFDMGKVRALLIGVSCHPGLYDAYRDKVITFNVNGQIDAWVSLLFNDTIPSTGCGSVSTNAFLIGSMMHSNPVVLVGQDLAFTGSKQYASKAADGSTDILLDNENNTYIYANMPQEALDLWEQLGISHKGGRTVTLPGYFGGQVTTKPDYAIFHGEFERLAASINQYQPDVQLFNCTEGGAFIQGFEHISLKHASEFIKKGSPKIDKDLLFEEIFASVEKKERSYVLLKTMEEITKKLNKSIALSIKCFALSKKAEINKNILPELSKIEKKLMHEIKSSNFLSIAVQEELKNAMKLSEVASNLKENLEASRNLYEIIKNQGSLVLPHVEKSTQQIKEITAFLL